MVARDGSRAPSWKSANLDQREQSGASGGAIAGPYPRCQLRDFRPATAGPARKHSKMEMIMKKIMCMVALGLALIGNGQAAFAQALHTGSAESEQSGGGTFYNTGRN